jgi:hypothetical protein
MGLQAERTPVSIQRMTAPPGAERGPRRRALRLRDVWADLVVSSIIVAGVVVYLNMLPRNLSPADESVHLYEAKRLLHGEVMYRDVFNYITPGWMYLMALLFGVFGTTVDTARIAAAVIHGLAAVAMFLTCRVIGVRRAVAWAPALLYLVLCQSAWPIASQHWLSTLLCAVILLFTALVLRDGDRWLVATGVAIGLLIAVQQPRGTYVAAGVFLWVILDHLLARWFAPRGGEEAADDADYADGRVTRTATTPSRPRRLTETHANPLYDPDLRHLRISGSGSTPAPKLLLTRLAWLVGSSAAVVVPLLLILIARASFARVWRALVIFPLYDYAGVTHCEWGHMNIMSAWQGSFTMPRVLKYLPVVLIPAIVRVTLLLFQRPGRAEARVLVLLLASCATAVASIWYFPDFIHIAFIAPVFLITAAESLEWAVQRVRLPRPAWAVVGTMAAIALVAFCGRHLQRNMVRLWQEHPFNRETAFGRVQFRNENDAVMYDRVKELIAGARSRYFYSYPVIAHLYLLLDVDNPSAHGFFVSGYSGPDLIAEVLRSLAATKPPYIVVLPTLVPKNDPVAEWITQHYEPVEPVGKHAQWIFYRARSVG